MEKRLCIAVFGSTLCLAGMISSAQAQDARSIGMGGATISVGQGVGGALSNPSLLMSAKRRKERYHFKFGGAGELRDSADVIGEAEDNQDSLDNIDREINTLSAQSLLCNPILDRADAPCLRNTQGLGDITQKVLNSFNKISGEPVSARGGSDLAFAVSHTRFPFMISIGMTATATGTANISEADRSYAETLIDAVSDNELSVGDIQRTASITFNQGNNSVEIESPDDILDSQAAGGAVVRTTITLGMATTFKLGKQDIDIGVSPKISRLTAGRINKTLNELNADTFDLEDEFDADRVSETSITFDVGASMQPLPKRDFRIGGVIRNVIPESIKTESRFEFETTPQLIISGAYQIQRILATADLALNQAKSDNFESQPLSIGGEFSYNWFSVRAGIYNDFAAKVNPTSFTFGFGLGAFDLGARVNGNNISGGMQIAFSL